MTWSIIEELRALQPVELNASANEDATPSAPEAPTDWGIIATALGRLGKQQMRSTQQTESVLEELRGALAHSAAAQEALREQSDDYRRRMQRLEADAREARQSALGILDALDDLAAIARQKQDLQWTSRVERLTARTLEALAEMGLTEVPAVDVPFDERAHEIIDTVERGSHTPFQVIDVLRRGFRFQGAVLRRAQVVTTR